MAIKIMILALVVAFVGLFFITGPDGEPIMTVDEFLSPPPMGNVAPDPGPTQVYRYQDENGVWHFSDEPVEGQDATAMELSGDINTMDAFKVPESSGSQPKMSAKLPDIGLPTSVNMGEMTEAMDDMQQAIEQRNEALKDINTGN